MRFRLVAFALPVLTLLHGTFVRAAAPTLHFNRDIRPLMSDTCFHCHGPDKNARKGGLRLDIREEALKPAKSGEIPIVPGKPEESEIIKRLFTTDHDDLMPPDEAHKEFTAEQKETFRRWVAEGAVYEPHWAYTPLVKPPVPSIPNSGAQTSKNPIDAFILEKLAEVKSKPSPQADAHTLIRRLSLDLTGLPPTPAETESFLQSEIRNPQSAITEAVERLLKSPHYGERMAVWWLDVARFTDTVGYHGDQNQRIFPYRDYVIDSFNQNKRFNRFTQEQIAGDLLPEMDPAKKATDLIASGFNRLNMVTREGGAQAKEYLAKYGAERVRTVGGAWLGATLGCCECHDHKFDPFKARDFYSMESFFADVKQWGVYADYGYTPNPELKGVGNDHPFAPEVQVDSAYLHRHAEQARNAMLEAASQPKPDAKASAEFTKWQLESRAFLAANPSGWATPTPEVKMGAPTQVAIKGGSKADAKAAKAAKKKEAKGPAPVAESKPEEKRYDIAADGRVVFKGKAADNSDITITPEAGFVSALRVELLPEDSHKGSILRDDSQNSASLKVTASVQRIAGKKPETISFRHADADLKEPRYTGGSEIIGVKDGWKTSAQAWNQPHTAVFVLAKPLKIAAGDKLTVQIAGDMAGCVRVSVSPLAPFPVLNRNFAAELAHDLGASDSAKDKKVQEAWLASTAWNEAAFREYGELYTKWLDCREGKTWTMVTQAVPNPLTIRILPRGNFMDESGPVVTPATPEFLPAAFRPQEGKRLTRLDLANWLCSKENPLTPRAFMNRLWKQFFGNGISSVVDDLGAQGEPPSHPELLDWLAAEFRDSGWDVKHMIRLMVTSQTYLQGSSLRPDMREIDPNNRLLSSQNPRRLDAEFVRDNALSIAGLINLDIGGPSVHPYQPAGYYVNLQFPSRDYTSDADAQQWRRGVYMHWQRTFLHPMLANFDAPMRDECTANRPSSNTPQQALTLLNDPTFVEAARVLATRLLSGAPMNDEARLGQAYELALARPIKDKEKTSLLAFLKSQRECYRDDSSAADKIIHIGNAAVCDTCDRGELAAWTNVCRVILNLHETITRY